ncbi:hypothetical protein HUJ04_003588, partial [Dendroctonus ponderosae]
MNICQINNGPELLVNIKEEITIEEHHLLEELTILIFRYQIKDSIELLVDIKEEMIIEEYQLNEMVKSEMNTDDETIHQNTVLNSPPASF